MVAENMTQQVTNETQTPQIASVFSLLIGMPKDKLEKSKALSSSNYREMPLPAGGKARGWVYNEGQTDMFVVEYVEQPELLMLAFREVDYENYDVFEKYMLVMKDFGIEYEDLDTNVIMMTYLTQGPAAQFPDGLTYYLMLPYQALEMDYHSRRGFQQIFHYEKTGKPYLLSVLANYIPPIPDRLPEAGLSIELRCILTISGGKANAFEAIKEMQSFFAKEIKAFTNKVNDITEQLQSNS